jgi:deoxycytidine triphosphate deaminase
MPNEKSPKEIEIERLRQYPTAPYHPRRRTHDGVTSGVLLSDEIEYYCRNYKLVDPYKPENIMAASYELRVGSKYAVAGKEYDLELGQTLKIPRFEVAVIQIYETINMPDFLVGRWNIRTRWAYEGLVWVGGPQVNPGYRGLLLCPIWNLSNKDFFIECGEAIAVMDFEVTTPPTVDSNRKPAWDERSRYVFKDYKSDKLRSGLVTDAVEKIAILENEVRDIRTRLDSSVAIIFAALGILVAALALFVGRQYPPEFSNYSPVLLLSTIAIISSLIAHLRWSYYHLPQPRRWMVEIIQILIVVALVVIGYGLFRMSIPQPVPSATLPSATSRTASSVESGKAPQQSGSTQGKKGKKQ